MKRVLFFFSILAAAACSDDPPKTLDGYLEGDTLYMASQEAGVVSALAVREGDRVEAGALLFRLDTERMSYAAEQASSTAAAVRQRAAPAGALDQAVAEAAAELRRVKLEFERTAKLYADGYATKARYDNDHALVVEAEARLERTTAERDAARHDVQSAAAGAELTQRRLDDLEVRAPAAGTVERIYRRPGEVTAAGDPVLALLPPENIKIKFFAPEPLLLKFAPGAEIGFSCDGCPAGMTARVSFVASEPQFTPPVIYSLDQRDRLVFLVEARPDAPAGLRPGQPVQVTVP